MKASKVNIGIVGAGSFADLWYLPILKMHPAVQLQAICSPSGVNAVKLAQKYDVLSTYDSYDEMIDREHLDGICIVTPNHSHHEIAIEACKRGIHVICEKPLAMNHEEARSMLEAAEENEIVHGVNFTYRENPAVKKLKELLKDEFIGELYEGNFQYTGAYGLSGPPGWRGTKSKGGIGGVLADLGSHLIDLVQYVLGEEVSRVTSSLSFLHEGKLKTIHEMESHDQSADSVSFHGIFPSGIHGSFYTSWITPQGNRNQTIELSFSGSKGAIQLFSSGLGIQLKYAHGRESWKDYPLECATKWADSNEPNEANFRPWRLTNRNEIWKWTDLILENKASGRVSLTSIPNFKDGYSVQQVIDAVILSAEHKREVLVEIMT
ncbi:Gfo/Idh/MocA family protein [Gracilibacillus alcaliphilus]|uniref:Gfo/Idh/MocA family protein n=1 Tax=Gracilibacillus alcaliphilus TaxID=1401441 RepID=UPI001955F989|nr:Gfo/Idh/MocA family oxidoreductase [Gracilibacillus alcaliphilus]MBM7678198.1 putative dehydrogenase [Gracilibacillus alcaliphilus]